MPDIPFTLEELDALISDAYDQIEYIRSRIVRMKELKEELLLEEEDVRKLR